ncbi:ParB/RepB/Spo0J family partition protein, partial [Sulfoacidibacillus thermotolerans]
TDVLDVDDNKAARMLISANVKTRTLSPMELAKAIRRERELIEQTYGERRGNPNLNSAHDEQNLKGLWSEQVSQEIGKSEQHIRRLDKLNELIPELQQLVDQGKLGTTVAEQLAYLTSDEQTALYQTFGKAIGKQSVAETKEVRKQIESERKAHEEAIAKVQQLQQELVRLQQEKQQNDKTEKENWLASIAKLETELAEARRELANRPQIEVVSNEIKMVLEEAREQNKSLKYQLDMRAKTEERLRKEKAQALEAKRVAEEKAIEEKLARERLQKTLASAGQSDEHFRLMKAMESKLLDLRKEAAGMMDVWDVDQISDELYSGFINLMNSVIASLQQLAQKKRRDSNNLYIFRKER